jgi:hypothetical protein
MIPTASWSMQGPRLIALPDLAVRRPGTATRDRAAVPGRDWRQLVVNVPFSVISMLDRVTV